MAIDFPASPTLNDEYSFEGRTWRWNATGWEVKAFVGNQFPAVETEQAIAEDYTITTGYNAISAGPVEVLATYTVTVPAGAVWVIV